MDCGETGGLNRVPDMLGSELSNINHHDFGLIDTLISRLINGRLSFVLMV
jgi:hypothetical protein